MLNAILEEAHTRRSHVPLPSLELNPEPHSDIKTIPFSKVYEKIEALDNLRIPSPPRVSCLSDLHFESPTTVEVPDAGKMRLTDWAQRRIGGMLGVKWHKFFDPMDPDVARMAIESHLHGLGPKCPKVKLVMRGLLDSESSMGTDGILRGVVSPAYSEFRDLHALDRLYEVGESVLDIDWGFSAVNLLDNGSHFTLILKEPFELIPGSGDLGYVGLRLRNSEVGAHSWTGSLIVIRQVCINGMIVTFVDTQYFRFVHKGMLVNRVDEPIEAALNRCYEVVHELPKAYEKLREFRIDDPQLHLEEFLERRGVSPKIRRAMAEAYNIEDVEGDNAYHVLQAITRLSPALHNDPNRQRLVEEVAGEYAQEVLRAA
jgi:hypothetical protein